jgi:hypothetical protein
MRSSGSFMHRREERPRATLGGHLGAGSRLYLWKSIGFHGNHKQFQGK